MAFQDPGRSDDYHHHNHDHGRIDGRVYLYFLHSSWIAKADHHAHQFLRANHSDVDDEDDEDDDEDEDEVGFHAHKFVRANHSNASS